MRDATDSYAGPIPRSVVPIFPAPALFSRAASRRRCHGRMTGARSERKSRPFAAHAGVRDERDLREERVGVDDDSGPDHGGRAADDAGGEEVEGEVAVGELDRVAGVVAAVIAGDDVEPIGEKVDDLSLSFVSPLAAENGCDLHETESYPETDSLIA